MVHPGGRPRTVTPPPEEMIDLGEEMLKWIEENDPIHLCQYYSFHKKFTDSQWDTMSRAPEFFPYYEQAVKMVGMKYLMKDNNIEPAIKQRWQRVYFKDLKQEEDERAKYNESVKAAQVQAGDTYVVYSPNSAAYTDGQISTSSVSKENPQCSK